ncbi:hypothetical protein BU23DRAFT_550141 [Bimuria novae-zelandiae CBS 107.79]|uniref:Uncharacterized protein n=1 Tax=Bimuria novae-zelandiae CBS 107.79 TaxID=1447943 RepID=A0A6A5VK31_9PLEO|nr:hypothetical protein BU23DRAFT_550141 [Bimuria novae-zelandiae CBS 107.79]
MVDLRAVSTPSLPLTPTSPTLQTSQDSFPFPTAEPKRGRQNFYNHNSQSEFFDRQTPCGSMEQSPYSSDTSRNSSRHRVSQWPDRHHVVRKADRSSRARSSLTPDGRPYVAKADVTFDSFLAPHASGKGETHRDSQYVKKGREPRSFSRRLSKMPSMPQLKKRASQAFSFSQKD